MTRKKYHYYVLVMTECGPVFVTSIEYNPKVAHWEKSEQPLEMDDCRAQDLVIGLLWNGYNAMEIKSTIEIDRQPYRYAVGELKWESKE